MKLRALKTLSNKRPKGAIFEENNRARAKMLVFIGVAEEVVEPPKPAAHPDQPVEPEPVTFTAPTRTYTRRSSGSR